jgi:hypothetical protein
MREVVVIDKSCACQRSSDRRSIHRPRKEADKEHVSNALILAEGHGLPLYLNISPSLPSAHTASPASPYVQGAPISPYALFTKIKTQRRVACHRLRYMRPHNGSKHCSNQVYAVWPASYRKRTMMSSTKVLRPYFEVYIKHFHRDSRGQPSSPQIANFCVYA